MAYVYRARDTRLDRDVAFKIIRTEMFPPALLQISLQRFEREAKALARISHPNIVNIFDYGNYEDAPFLVMEYLAGKSLRERLGNPVPFQQAAAYLAPIAQALAYAHSENIIHRDVKPANILFTERGMPKLSDFGIAKVFGGQESVKLTGSSIAVGTPAYMAPEQWSGKTSPASDAYALGVVFYELLTGKPPYQSDTPGGLLVQILTKPLPDARAVVPDLPDDVTQILTQALAKTPEERFGSMDEFAVALENLATWKRREPVSIQSDAPTVVKKHKDTQPSASPAVETDQPFVRDETVGSGKVSGAAVSAPKTGGKISPRAMIQWSSIALLFAAGLIGLMLGLSSLGLIEWPSSGQAATRPTTTEPGIGSISATQSPALPQDARTDEPTNLPARATDTPQPSHTSTSLAAHILTASPTITQSPTSQIFEIIIDEDWVNLRSGPGTVYSIVGNKTRGAVLEVVGRNAKDDWLVVKLNERGELAWISIRVIRYEFEVSLLPVYDTPPTPVVVKTKSPDDGGGADTGPPPSWTPPSP